MGLGPTNTILLRSLLVSALTTSITIASTYPISCETVIDNKVFSFNMLSAARKEPMPRRLELISRQFLGAPYSMYVLGDSLKSDIDQCPLIRLDKFDCETFVTSMLALAFSNNKEDYIRCLRILRYHDGEVGFLTRHHFTSSEWNRENIQQGFIQDITKSIVNKHKKNVFKLSRTMIDKAAWLKKLPASSVRLVHQEEVAKKLNLLKQQAAACKKVYVKLPYIPLTELFLKNGQANNFLFNQIPNGAIIEIIRPNWNLKNKIGTNLDVSHMGFAFRYNGKLWFRNASSLKQKVIDVPLVEYLKLAQSSSTIKGINVQIVLSNAHC